RVDFISQPRSREHAVELVERGEIDAALEPYALHATANMRYLMSDYRQAEKGFFQRTGAYTINHLFALRREIFDEQPEVADKLLAALIEANSRADRYRDEKQRRDAA